MFAYLILKLFTGGLIPIQNSSLSRSIAFDVEVLKDFLGFNIHLFSYIPLVTKEFKYYRNIGIHDTNNLLFLKMFLCPFANYVEHISWPQKLSQTMCFHKTQWGLDRRTLAISDADKKSNTQSACHM